MAKKTKSDLIITNEEVSSFVRTKDELTGLLSRIETLQLKVSEKEIEFIKALRNKKLAQNLKYDLGVVIKKGRYPKWKEAFVHRLGEKEADKVFNKTKPIIHKHITVRKKLKIEMVD
jgi:hypothetical protein